MGFGVGIQGVGLVWGWRLGCGSLKVYELPSFRIWDLGFRNVEGFRV